MLELTLLGSPEVHLAGRPVTGFRSSKAQALLFYLAVAQRPVQRGTIVGLFWPEQDESQARTNLNQTLSNLRKLLGDYIVADRQALQLDRALPLRVDVTAFAAAARQGAAAPLADLQRAAELYRGDFLEGFFVRDAAEFENWLAAERAHLRELAIYLFGAASSSQAERGELAQAAEWLRRLLRLEPWREDQQRALMHLLARSGQRAAAIAQFDLCRRALAAELDVEPAPATLALLEQIRSGALAADPPAAPPAAPAPVAAPPAPVAAPRLLPADATPFVGRAAELTQIAEQLRDPACRLLTLVGHGGLGKSRLALQAARGVAAANDARFANGVVFVPLAPVERAEAMVGAIAQALGFHFYDNAPPRRQLIDHLREKQMLLVLDNLEHLPESGSLIEELLAAAPGLCILATSRTALDLAAAWFMPIAGLATPRKTTPDGAHAADYDAVQLFVQSARRAQVGFALASHEADVVRICQLVDGTPLAIELAAAWLRVLPIGQIAQEITTNLDLLTARHQNAPPRQRSMRVVFEASWRLLPDAQRASLRRLAVCPGGFDTDAARQIADASLFDLAMLVEKSLLRADATGRYTMHPLLRQFALERLDARGETVDARHRHCVWYLDLLVDAARRFTGSEQRAALNRVDADFDNLEAAWLWAVEQEAWPDIHRAAPALYDFLQIRSRYADGEQLFSRAVTQVTIAAPLTDPALRTCCLRLRVWLGAFRFALSDNAGAAAVLEPAWQEATAADILDAAALAANLLGQIAGWSGDRQAARRWLEESQAICERSGDMLGLANALHKLAQIQSSFGDYAAARTLAETSLRLCQRYGRPDWTGYAYDVLGWATFCLGDYGAAASHYRASLAAFEASGDRLGAALAMGGIGSVDWAHGGERLAAAAQAMQTSLTLCRTVGHRQHVASRLWYLAQIANDGGDHHAAAAYSREGLAIAEAVGSRVFMSYNLCSLGDAAIGLDDAATGVAHLLAVLRLACETDHLPPAMIALVSLGRCWYAQSLALPVDAAARGALQILAATALHFVQQQPASWACFRVRAGTLLAVLEKELAPATWAGARQQAASLDLPGLVASLRDPANGTF